MNPCIFGKRPSFKFLSLCLTLYLVFSIQVFAREKAPEFTLKDIDGKPVKLSELLKKGPVLIDFWATWCKPCLEELPTIQEIHKTYASQGLQVVAISTDNTKSRSRVKPYVKSQGFDFLILMDETLEVRRLFGGTQMPFTALIHPDGSLYYTHLGYTPGDEKKLEEAVKKLFEDLKSQSSESIDN